MVWMEMEIDIKDEGKTKERRRKDEGATDGELSQS